MNLRDLRYLVALADTRHFGHAATKSHVSQPTLSAQIKKLEDYLGAPLVERQPRNVSLTEVGESGFLPDLADRPLEGRLAGLEPAFGQIPVPVGPQQQEARAVGGIAHDHDPRGALEAPASHAGDYRVRRPAPPAGLPNTLAPAARCRPATMRVRVATPADSIGRG